MDEMTRVRPVRILWGGEVILVDYNRDIEEGHEPTLVFGCHCYLVYLKELSEDM